jgi:hypothetical protein
MQLMGTTLCCLLHSHITFFVFSSLAPFLLSRHYTPHYVPLYPGIRGHVTGLYFADMHLVPGKFHTLTSIPHLC